MKDIEDTSSTLLSTNTLGMAVIALLSILIAKCMVISWHSCMWQG